LKKKNSIAIITDNVFDKKLLSNILSEYSLTFYEDVNEAYKGIRKNAPKLVLIDSSYDNSAFALCRYISEDVITSNIPIIFMFSSIDRENLNTMFGCGGNDYLLKPFNQLDVITRIYVHINHANQKRKLESLANFDPMTKTLNRQSFFDKASKAMEFSKRQKSDIHLSIFNFSTLFEINENYGHFTGDRIIQEISDILKETLGKNAIIGRLNGNYFSALLLNCDDEKVENLSLTVAKKTAEISIDGVKPVKVEYATVKRYSLDESIDDLFLEISEHLINCNIARTKRNY
jgi:diguanylate cyclase (GGDEF)-like protein